VGEPPIGQLTPSVTESGDGRETGPRTEEGVELGTHAAEGELALVVTDPDAALRLLANETASVHAIAAPEASETVQVCYLVHRPFPCCEGGHPQRVTNVGRNYYRHR